MQPLEGIRVLDLTRLLPGPWCSQLLADFGADVVKIEEPSQGDYSRAAPPHYEEKSVYFMNVNRNKRSVTLDLKTERGTEVFFDLVETADVVFESFRPGVADRLGIGYDDVQAVNDDVIYCSLTGFGSTGPASEFAGHDLNIAGMTGLLRIHGQEPKMPVLQIADYGGAVSASLGILIALLGRERGASDGQHVDASMFDGALSWLTPSIADTFVDSDDPQIRVWGGSPRYNIYETADGEHLTVSLLEQKFWDRFCQLLGREDFINEDESVEARLTSHGEFRDDYAEFLTETFASRPRDEWVELLQAEDIPCTPVYDMSEVLEDEQVRARDMIRTVEDPTEGEIHQLGPPVALSETPGEIRSLAPDLGEHTDELLAELDYDETERAELAREGVTEPREGDE